MDNERKKNENNDIEIYLGHYKVPEMRHELAERIAGIPVKTAHGTAFFMRFAITALLLMISVFAGIKTADIFKPDTRVETISRNEFREMFELYSSKNE